MKSVALHSVFHDLLAYGSVRIRKSKLLWLLDRSHETPTAWDLLLLEWRDFGQTRSLYASNWNDEITLSTGEPVEISERGSGRHRDEMVIDQPTRAPFLPHVVA